jgi:hypothetical protein
MRIKLFDAQTELTPLNIQHLLFNLKIFPHLLKIYFTYFFRTLYFCTSMRVLLVYLFQQRSKHEI